MTSVIDSQNIISVWMSGYAKGMKPQHVYIWNSELAQGG